MSAQEGVVHKLKTMGLVMPTCMAAANEIEAKDARITSLESENARLLTVNARLTEALKPFASESIGDEIPDSRDLHGYTFQAGNFRKARAALAGHEPAAPTMTAERMRIDAANIALAIDSGRGNEKEIAKAIMALPLVPASPGKGAE